MLRLQRSLECLQSCAHTQQYLHANLCKKKNIWSLCVAACLACLCECASMFRCGARLLEAWLLPGFDKGGPQIRSKSGPGGMPASLRGKWDIFTRTKSASNWPQRALCTSNQQPTATSRTQTRAISARVCVCPSRPREVKRGPSVRVSVTNCTFPHKRPAVSNRTSHPLALRCFACSA